ncbi:hypothetical protein PHJA_002883100 [Phtheirospermum japonicum]|uniref:Uncharacterized protein n=1 Tax=Phtheirospermum japonicum TaxID=374723 RepID=A0A830D823_9LAMI|nr:hypothetical protein PHJA_002883100 [Phtheirospermum japonicum]
MRIDFKIILLPKNVSMKRPSPFPASFNENVVGYNECFNRWLGHGRRQAGFLNSNQGQEKIVPEVTDLCATFDGSLIVVAIQSLPGIMVLRDDLLAVTLPIAKEYRDYIKRHRQNEKYEEEDRQQQAEKDRNLILMAKQLLLKAVENGEVINFDGKEAGSIHLDRKRSMRTPLALRACIGVRGTPSDKGSQGSDTSGEWPCTRAYTIFGGGECHTPRERGNVRRTIVGGLWYEWLQMCLQIAILLVFFLDALRGQCLQIAILLVFFLDVLRRSFLTFPCVSWLWQRLICLVSLCCLK